MANPLQVSALTFRSVKGSELSQNEADQNFSVLRDFCNTLGTLIFNALNADGTLKDNAVITSSIKDLAVTISKLDFGAGGFVGRDTGVADHLAVTFSTYPTAYVSGMVLYVVVANNNTQPAKIKVASGATTWLDEVPIRKLNNLELAASDLVANSVICLVYDDSDKVFKLVAVSSTGGGSSGSTSANFTGLTSYAPSDRALPGNGSSNDYTHGLNAVPKIVLVQLKCLTAELGFSVGDQVPLTQFFDGGNDPAFAVQITATDVKVTQLTATPKVNAPNGSGASAITPANWTMSLTAYKITDASTPTFPALEIQVANPDTGISFGNLLYWFNYGNGSTKSFLNKYDQSNNNVAIAANGVGKEIHSPARRFINAALFRASDGNRKLFYTCSAGLFHYDLDQALTVSYGAGAAQYNHKPVWIDESVSGFQDAAHPSVYCVQSSYLVGNTDSLEMVKLSYNGTTYGSAAVGSVLNLRDNRINNVSVFNDYHSIASSTLLFSYNKYKNRIYVISTDTGLLHIFQLDNTHQDISAWWVLSDASRYPALTYVKAIAVPGGGGYWADTSRERYTIEWDTVTGQEIAIVFSRVNRNEVTGQIVRVPWKE